MSDHDPATCRDGDHYGQCGGATIPCLGVLEAREEAEARAAMPDPVKEWHDYLDSIWDPYRPRGHVF